MMPRLEHVYLHLSCLCDELFHAIQPRWEIAKVKPARKLRTCTLNLAIDRRYSWESRSTWKCGFLLRGPIEESHLVQMQRSRAFPRLERLTMISLAYQSGQTSGPKVYTVEEIATQTTTKCPFEVITIPKLARAMIRRTHHDLSRKSSFLLEKQILTFLESMGLRLRPLGDLVWECALLVFEQEDVVYLGSDRTAREAIISNAGWCENVANGTRAPRSSKARTTQEGLDTRHLVEWSVLGHRWTMWVQEKRLHDPRWFGGFKVDRLPNIRELRLDEDFCPVTVEHHDLFE
ncbi:hypothetical protein K491DRAFT_22200 [Lophiostoma macrostomum CBS 122681]|uniref:Uncharacterized protein n=1 Tax=Lophiostoma macrostomum CBS 122681 TaxID=1314788 RepID=A0A6A6SZ94_9PLEO|nr:hypothetical protein K491DRAFT_22200 [Lophiostoma macrostomum CBS 122681]